MRMYLLSLGAGLLVGVIYSLLNVRSPAPPLVALVGLLGILAGEQVIPLGRQVLAGTSLAAAWHTSKCASHLFGELPGRHAKTPADTAALARSQEARS
jgi:XapX domain-containing protein